MRPKAFPNTCSISCVIWPAECPVPLRSKGRDSMVGGPGFLLHLSLTTREGGVQEESGDRVIAVTLPQSAQNRRGPGAPVIW